MKTTTAHDAPTRPTGRGESDEHPLRTVVRGWDRFWFNPADPTTLGLIRVSAGLVVLYVHLVYCIGLMNYLGPDAWVVNTGWSDKTGEKGVTDFVRHGNPQQVPGSSWNDTDGEIIKGQAIWSIWFHVEDPTWVWVIHSTILVIMFLFTIGLWTRVTSVLTWIGALMYIQRFQGSMLFGLDTMTNLVLLYLMIGPSGAALSVDRWLKVRRERLRLGPAYVPQPPEPMVSANFAIRLIQINFCIIYLAAGTSKLLGTSWWNGTAPNRFLLNYSFAPMEVAAYTKLLLFLSKHRWMWELVCAGGVIGTLFVELSFPFLVWNRFTRWIMICGSVLLHTMIALMMGLVTFSLVMIAMVLSFVPPEAVRQGLHSLGESVEHIWDRLFPQARRATKKQPLALSR